MAASDVEIEDPISPIDLKLDVRPDEISSGLTADTNTTSTNATSNTGTDAGTNAGTNAGTDDGADADTKGKKVKGVIKHRRPNHHKRHLQGGTKLRSQLSALHHPESDHKKVPQASRKSSINNKKHNVKNKSVKRTYGQRRHADKKIVHSVDRK